MLNVLLFPSYHDMCELVSASWHPRTWQWCHLSHCLDGSHQGWSSLISQLLSDLVKNWNQCSLQPKLFDHMPACTTGDSTHVQNTDRIHVECGNCSPLGLTSSVYAKLQFFGLTTLLAEDVPVFWHKMQSQPSGTKVSITHQTSEARLILPRTCGLQCKPKGWRATISACQKDMLQTKTMPTAVP